MDILAHGLWAWAGGEVLRRRGRVTRRTLAIGVTLAVLPDVLQMLPVLAGWLAGTTTWPEVFAFAAADPGREPILAWWVAGASHHLHCAMHSLIVAGAVTLAVRIGRPDATWPLLGWWLHIALDVPTHSADYYAVPVFYPVTQRGFDGVAWNAPWFVLVNYVALAVVAVWLWIRRRG